MKRLTIKVAFALTLIVAGLCNKGMAQQQGQYSQYMMNYFLVNPAVAGSDDFVDFRMGYRMQWVGLSGAPRNYYASFHMPINKVHRRSSCHNKKGDPYHVMGGMFSGQKLGAFTHNTGYFSYAYHLPLSEKWALNAGSVLGFNQFSIDNNRLDWGDNYTDLSSTGQNQLKFDLGLGLWLYSPNAFFGISSMQMLHNQLQFNYGDINNGGFLNRHFYATGGYKFDLDQDLKFIPSIMVRNTITAVQMDINAKVRYKNLVWGGVSYRRTDAVVILAGVGIPLTNDGRGNLGNNARIEIGYSYDATTSRLKTYSSGSHEIMVALLCPLKGRLVCPSDYW